MARIRLLWCALALIVLAALCGCGGGGGEPAASASTAACVPADGVRAAQGEQLLGDMDNDGTPGVADAIAILRVVVGLAPDTPYADPDQDGMAGVSDAIKMLRLVVHLESTWPLAWQTAWVSGSLVDVLLGVGLSEVVVEVGGKTAKSDENGLFQVKGVPLGSQLLSVTLDPRLGSALVAEPPSTVDVSAPRTDLEPFYTVSDALAPPEAPGW